MLDSLSALVPELTSDQLDQAAGGFFTIHVIVHEDFSISIYVTFD